MKRLIIQNIGPLKKVDIEFGKLNVIIGTQSSGKSCVLKLACYCSWEEKMIMLTRFNDSQFSGSEFIDNFVEYYKMNGYVRDNSSVSYESPFIELSYKHKDRRFQYSLKNNYWRYVRPVISYIPTDRNIVSLFSGFQKLENLSSHLQDYAKQWDNARNSFAQSKILNLGLEYHYDKKRDRDLVSNTDGSEMDLSSTSSGVQSFLPLYILVDYLTGHIFDSVDGCTTNLSISKAKEVEQLLEFWYDKIAISRQSKSNNYITKVKINSKAVSYSFGDDKERTKFLGYVDRLLHNDHSELFIEEPENNIFPPTQAKFIDWLLEKVSQSYRNDLVFIATHSPYVLTSLLEKKDIDVNLFFTYSKNDKIYVKTASKDDIQDIYDFGVDVFFNYDSLV